ncbi:CpsD/CapB family tyrosine-protein kinase [Ruegeria marina]|uniref:Chromosome partitioning ATPase, Mrp family, contains Fe-S cluster n=1 Tax=Ruegeria marina TaxID=639004 RepID=A0A1G6T4E9_9RHOB|nr:CpsD/CapB family tyrosine-protein kinase [Ruegeria marina]SDD24040.1 Chromosome partitioning ATPase, Mrp family, contains Fe-S cluster [Ruegeria marina]
MAYHGRNLGLNGNVTTVMQGPKKTCDDELAKTRPFRRKAALRAEAEEMVSQPQTQLSTRRPQVEPAHYQLPATQPEPWERLAATPLRLSLPRDGRMPLVNLFRTDPVARAFDVMRTRVLQALKAKGWTRIAIAAPTAGCGATFTSVNLALSMARVPASRTVLLDLNMRDPGVASALELPARADMRRLLKGETSYLDHLTRCSDTLAVGLGAGPVRDASELLHSGTASDMLDQIQQDLRPDVVLCDLPPVLGFDDLVALVPRIDGVLLVADGTRTTSEQIRRCEQVLGADVPLLGVVLNRGRGNGAENYVV